MRYKGKVDANQKQIVSHLRQIGASVLILSSVGSGCPDILVGYRGVNYLMEIKDGRKVPSAQKLTRDELAFHDSWRGQVAVIRRPAEAFEIIGITG